MQRFCIVTTGRTGSNLLVAMLDRVPGIRCHGEIFHNTRIPAQLAEAVAMSQEERDQDPLGFLARLERVVDAERPDTHIWGFKLFIWHNERVLEHVLSEGAYRVVVLDRENRLAQYSSLQLARASGAWKSWKATAGQEPPRAEFRLDEFTSFMEQRIAWYSQVRDALEGTPHLWLQYGELFDPLKLRALLEFLGSDFAGDPHALMRGGRFRKQNTPKIDERFTNPAEVAAAMRELGRESWLVDDGGSLAPGAHDDLPERIRRLVDQAVPLDATVVVVSRGDPELVELEGREGWHFPRTPEGTYAGHHPGSGDEAIEHLDALRAAGGEYLLLPSTAYWWLDEYPELADWLSENSELRLDEPETCKLFALARR